MIYLLQLMVLTCFALRPLSARMLPGSSVRAELRKDIHILHSVPFLGAVLLAYPENYHVILTQHGVQKIIMIDVKEDLPLEDLQAVNEKGAVIVTRARTRTEIVRFSVGAGENYKL